MKNLFLSIFFLTFMGFAQTRGKIDLTEGNISEKFDQLYRKSETYKQYKVVDHQLLLQLKKMVLDSLNKKNMEIVENEAEIEKLEKEIDQLQNSLQALNAQVENLNEQKDTIGFLGAAIYKSKFKLIMWLMVLGLLTGLLYFVYAFKNSHLITKTAQENLEKLEEEYNNFRTMALEREQRLKRQLIDERKKLLGSS